MNPSLQRRSHRYLLILQAERSKHPAPPHAIIPTARYRDHAATYSDSLLGV